MTGPPELIGNKANPTGISFFDQPWLTCIPRLTIPTTLIHARNTPKDG